MLPSRGISTLHPTSGLRQSLPNSTQTISWRTSRRQFSQIQRLGQSSTQRCDSKSAALRGLSGRLPQLSSQLGSRPIGYAGAAVASRSLSLWPFWSKQQPVDPKSAVTPTPTPTLNDAASSSTASASASAPTTAPPSIETVSAPLEPLTTHSDPISASVSPELYSDLDAGSILDIPEQIGYLKQLGLDFGWGPTAMCEWLLEHTYIYSGMPWWATIATVAVGLRLLLAYPTLVGTKHAARMAALQRDPQFARANQEMKEIMWNPDADNMAKMKARAKVMQMTKAADVSMLKSIVPPLLMVPVGFGMFRILRSMATLPVPSLEAGGFLWLMDLSAYDPTYALPLVTAALSSFTMGQHQKANGSPTAQAAAMAKFIRYGMPPLMFLCTMWLPAAVQWYFFVFSAASVVQTSATLNPAVRRWADLPPLPSRPAPALSSSPSSAMYQAPARNRGIRERLNDNIATMSKGLDEYTGGEARAAVKKAQDYEKRRAQEEKEKALQRLLEHNRKKLHRGN
ncbi:60Kd inner membrane protein-domain-containing protein [Xylariales sp. PMI_506]|nr:60Kd inner membrane protein-domain-containing protein [Xylariales sp. PMI_506]